MLDSQHFQHLVPLSDVSDRVFAPSVALTVTHRAVALVQTVLQCAACMHGCISASLRSSWALSGAVSHLPPCNDCTSIAFLQQRTNQAPRSRYTVPPSRADSHRRPGRWDGGGTAEDDGLHNRCEGRIYGGGKPRMWWNPKQSATHTQTHTSPCTS